MSCMAAPKREFSKREFSNPAMDELDRRISYYQDTLIPRSSHRRASLLTILSSLRLDRYLLSGEEQLEDLEASILLLTQAIFLPFLYTIKGGPNLILAFFDLVIALLYHVHKSRQPSDVRYCIKYLLYLRDPSLEAFGLEYNRVIALYVHALAVQVDLESDNTTRTHGLEEMAALCRKLLSSDFSEPDPRNVQAAVVSLGQAVYAYLTKSWNQLPQQVIECLHEANTRLPHSYDVAFALSYHFSHRFDETQSNEDYERAMAPLDKIIASHPPKDIPRKHLRRFLILAAQLADRRFTFYGNPEYLEEAIVRTRARLDSVSLDDPERGDIIRSLDRLERARFNEFGITSDVPDAQPGDPEAIDLPSFSHLATLLVKSPPMTVDESLPHLTATGTLKHIVNKADIEEAVKYCRLLCTSLPRSPDDMQIITHLILGSSGNFFYRAFELTNNPAYLNEAIDVHRGILKLPSAQWIHFEITQLLISFLRARYQLYEDTEDFNETMELYTITATDTYTKVARRFKISCQWAKFARAFAHPSVHAAYKNAIALMQESLTFSPTLEIQHHRLISMRDDFQKLPLDGASHQIHIGQLKEAIETLERGRGLLWSEMRGLRASIDHLRIANSRLAERFTGVNRDLEILITSGSPILGSNEGDVGGNEEMDALGRIVVKQRKLSDERASLIAEIRSLPGFENFLTAPSFNTLRSAAACGPVIIINHSEWRSDIIILLHHSPPSLITTTDDFYHRARCSKDQLFAARKGGLDSTEYNDALNTVLETLYDLVGRPVIKRLRELNVPEQSRIWWCLTSVFCSLPLHAMGPIRSEGSVKLYFSDLYISSYTPTLSALIESRKPGSLSFEKPPILLVSQPDEWMPKAWEEMALVRRLDTKVTTLLSKRATPSAVMKRLEDHRFAHFSCHGILETGKPFDASFKLYDGERLTLLEIIRSRLPSAEFAFLSACHTAELTEESIADEGLHLSAAVQYSGFRSVVGTMWAMADIDGAFLAKNFYESLFSERWEDVPYYERTAKALRDAVKELRRRKNVTTERWVNFVHYGA